MASSSPIGASPWTPARAVGLGRGGVEDRTTYRQEREPFGQSLSEFQALRFKLAETSPRSTTTRVQSVDYSTSRSRLRSGSADVAPVVVASVGHDVLEVDATRGP
jgi:alkylation response protein AidB-like acyl-CoA dehydrogenase